MFSSFFFYGGVGAFVLRLALAAILIVHGSPKLAHPGETAKAFNGMGFRPGIFWGTVAGIVELVGGILLAVGFFTACVSSVIALQFLVILVWRISMRHRFVGGWEFDLLIFGAAIFLALNGAGAFSLDRAFFFGW